MGHSPGPSSVPDPAAPNTARIYNFLIGGSIHDPADRAAAGRILADFPEFGHIARANRAFVGRAVRYVAAQGVTQFIDAGTGLPAPPAIHETARRVNPGTRVAYVDDDPVVLAHARDAAAGQAGLAVVPGDLRDTTAILRSADLQPIDLSQPVCVVLTSVLHLLPPAVADAAVAGFRSAMVAGSFLAVTCGTSTGTSPAFLERLRSVYADTSDITGRPAGEIAAWFTGLDLAPPGLVDVQAWRPDPGTPQQAPVTARILGGVARQARPGPAQAAPEPARVRRARLPS